MYLDPDSILNKKDYDRLKSVILCNICKGILIEPTVCKGCLNIFCEACLKKFLSDHEICPFNCKNRSFFIPQTKTIFNNLSILTFQCKCAANFLYNDYIKHFGNCEAEETECIECNNMTLKRNVNIRLQHFNVLKSNLNKSINANDQFKTELSDLHREIDTLKAKEERSISFNTFLFADKIRKEEEIRDINRQLRSILNSINHNQKSELDLDINKYLTNEKPITLVSTESKEQLERKEDIRLQAQKEAIIEYNIFKKIPLNLDIPDKCKHFIFNHVPFFICCGKLYSCYFCHDENETHSHLSVELYLCLECRELTNITKRINNCEECRTEYCCIKL